MTEEIIECHLPRGGGGEKAVTCINFFYRKILQKEMNYEKEESYKARPKTGVSELFFLFVSCKKVCERGRRFKSKEGKKREREKSWEKALFIYLF